ncbi:MAG: tetraacyldisaccharide 4'-kinase [Deltaproteobacteria bacterium]|nr:tetraacyldisaccharide 4'-kinase [Deltaproteobacteria bacterium]
MTNSTRHNERALFRNPEPASQYLLTAPAILYGLFMAGRSTLYELIPGLSRKVEIPVICVGNLTTGGTGKTPMVAYLADYFRKQGLQVAILSRGYGRRLSKQPLILPPHSPSRHLSTRELGDEALMLHQQRPEAALVLDGDRVRGAETAIKQLGPDLILMDDGLQHRRLRRNFNLVMIDSQKLFGNRRLLPAGSLRESLTAIRRADAVVLNKFDQHHPQFYREAAEILNHISPARLFCARYNFRHFAAAAGNAIRDSAAMKKLGPFCAFSGLANNQYFFAQLRALGLHPEETISFSDHHHYQAGDLKDLLKRSASLTLVTTAKDAVKLKALTGREENPLRQRLWVAEIGLKIDNEDRFSALFKPFLTPSGRQNLKAARP